MALREILNWFSTSLFVIGTISLISPHVAAVAISPWIAFLIGNIIWLVDAYCNNNKPWIAVSSFFIAWDILLIAARIYGMDVFSFLHPIITILETLP